MKKIYKTRELKWWEKLLQAYWANPKSWILEDFTIEDDVVTIRVKNGNMISAPIEELKIRTQTDKYDRRECYVQHGDKKLHFKEITWMLTDEEWDELFAILDTVPDSGLTKAAWFVSIAKVLVNAGDLLIND